MQAQDPGTQVTFHYSNGQAESFNIPLSAQEFQQKVQQLLEQTWLTLHLFDQTILICLDKVIKIEIKPPMPQLQGKGVFANSERVTALSRGAAR